MNATQSEPFEQPALSEVEGLIHDVNSKCASLKSAAALLKDVSDQEKRELLELMEQQAGALVKTIAEHKNRQ
ncbi:MAG: hypothetical protein HY747_00510 [Elusimicrobia bacterium]|nr:hypothetical protein [Elusimicrobiota bacterium]